MLPDCYSNHNYNQVKMKLVNIYFLIPLTLLVITVVVINSLGNTRPLTKYEIKELQSVFFEQVDYSKITLVTANLPPTLAALVFGNFILYREEYHNEDFSHDYLKMGRLVHEVGHVWANQTKGLQTSVYAVLEQIRYQDKVYTHKLLTGENSLDEFRYEQQCRILSDYYINRHLGFDITQYESTIYKTIKIK